VTCVQRFEKRVKGSTYIHSYRALRITHLTQFPSRFGTLRVPSAGNPYVKSSASELVQYTKRGRPPVSIKTGITS
jgi:hypothetical protein